MALVRTTSTALVCVRESVFLDVLQANDNVISPLVPEQVSCHIDVVGCCDCKCG